MNKNKKRIEFRNPLAALVYFLIFICHVSVHAQSFYKPTAYTTGAINPVNAIDGKANGVFETSTYAVLDSGTKSLSGNNVVYSFGSNLSVRAAKINIFRSARVGMGFDPEGRCRIEYTWDGINWSLIEDLAGQDFIEASSVSAFLKVPDGANLNTLKVSFSASPGVVYFDSKGYPLRSCKIRQPQGRQYLNVEQRGGIAGHPSTAISSSSAI